MDTATLKSQLTALAGDEAMLAALLEAGKGEIVLSDAGVMIATGDQEFGAEVESEESAEPMAEAV